MKSKSFCSGWLWVAILCLFAAINAAAAVKPLSEAEGASFGRKIEQEFNGNDSAYYVQAFDLDAFLDRAFPEQKDLGDQWNEFKRGFQDSYLQTFGKQLRLIASCKYLSTRQVAGKTRVLLRMLMRNGAVNYHELILIRGQDGQPRIADVFLYVTGETMSDTARRAALPALIDSQKSLLQRIFTTQSDLITHYQHWRELMLLSGQGRYQQVLNAYADLPASLQKEKFILVQQIRASQMLGRPREQLYLQALELWQRTYPDDPSIDLISIDACLLRKHYDEALGHVDRLDRAVGGDPYLDVQRAFILEMKGDDVKAEAAAKRAIEREPTLLRAYDALLASLVHQHRFAEAVALLTKIEKMIGVSRRQLAAIVENGPLNKDLVRSDEYHQWLLGTSAAQPTPVAASGEVQTNR